jgi:hypothetical protein
MAISSSSSSSSSSVASSSVDVDIDNDEFLNEILDVAINAAILAGDIILENTRTGKTDVTKTKDSSRDLLTLIDPLCEKVGFFVRPRSSPLGWRLVVADDGDSSSSVGDDGVPSF